MKIYSPEDVRALDTNSKWLGLHPKFLMENAGRGVADTIEEKFPPNKFPNVVVVCGTGNNGGDGFVAARHLATKGYNVTVALLGTSKNIRSDESRHNWELLEKMIFSVKLIQIRDSTSLNKLEKPLSSANIVVDAILGVGSRGAPRGLYGEAIKLINKYKENVGFKIVAIDIPSGLDVFEGRLYEPGVRANITITFVASKNGLTPEIGGEIVIKHIGQPPEAEILVGPGDVLRILKDRPANSHKGDYGRIMIVGGSKEYYGAPALSGLAALNTGADLVFIYAPKPAAEVIKTFSPDLIVRPLDSDFISVEQVDFLLSEADNMDVVIVGPGISVNDIALDGAYKLISELLSKGKKVVVDADGLKALAKFGLLNLPRNGKLIITPHAGEFKKIFNVKPSDDVVSRGEQVKELAEKHSVTILLKGHIDVISNGSEVKFNVTGNPGMTVGGTGDVLTGITGALFSLTDDTLLAAASAAFLSGLAGDYAYRKKGYSLLATDVAAELPNVIRDIQSF